jgi:transposase
MAASRKYPDELGERETAVAVDLRKDPAMKPGAIAPVAERLGMHPDTFCKWAARLDGGVRPGTTTEDASRIAELEREVRELRRTNEILTNVRGLFFAAAELARGDRRRSGQGSPRLHRCPPRPCCRGTQARSRADLCGAAGCSLGSLRVPTTPERTYHRRRRQQTLNRLTPIEYETIMPEPATQAA